MVDFKPELSTIQYKPFINLIYLWFIVLILYFLSPSFAFNVLLPLIILFSLIILLPLPLYKTLGYNISDDGIVISYLWLKRIISFEQILTINIYPSSRVMKFRKMGIGIPFFIKFGLYTGDFGDVMAYTTSSQKLLLIELKNRKKIAINPEKLDVFIELYTSHLKKIYNNSRTKIFV